MTWEGIELIKVIAKVFVKEDRIVDLKKYAAIMAPVTRQESGCISYQLFQDSQDSKVFIFLEEWKSEEALSDHMAAKHVKEFEEQMQGGFEKDVEVTICRLIF